MLIVEVLTLDRLGAHCRDVLSSTGEVVDVLSSTLIDGTSWIALHVCRSVISKKFA